MKKFIGLAVVALGLSVAAADYQFIEVTGAARGQVGKVVAFDVQSTNATQTATLNRVRSIAIYTNALDISSFVVTNRVYFPWTIVTNGVTNVVQGVSNVVSTVTVTNGWKKSVAASLCVTSEIASVTCAGGFATTNVNGWVLKDDAIYVKCSDRSAKTTVVIIK